MLKEHEYLQWLTSPVTNYYLQLLQERIAHEQKQLYTGNVCDPTANSDAIVRKYSHQVGFLEGLKWIHTDLPKYIEKKAGYNNE